MYTLCVMYVVYINSTCKRILYSACYEVNTDLNERFQNRLKSAVQGGGTDMFV
jgi:hypothetical protein